MPAVVQHLYTVCLVANYVPKSIRASIGSRTSKLNRNLVYIGDNINQGILWKFIALPQEQSADYTIADIKKKKSRQLYIAGQEMKRKATMQTTS